MRDPSHKEFGKRKPAVPETSLASPPAKRSRHVALLLTGTLAVGGTAFALMPSEHCEPTPAGMTAPATANCTSRGSSSSGGTGSGSWSRTSFFGGDTANRTSSGSASEPAAKRREAASAASRGLCRAFLRQLTIA